MINIPPAQDMLVGPPDLNDHSFELSPQVILDYVKSTKLTISLLFLVVLGLAHDRQMLYH